MVNPRIAMDILAFTDGVKFDLFCCPDIFYTSGNCSDQKKHYDFNNYSLCVWGFRIFSVGFGVSALKKLRLNTYNKKNHLPPRCDRVSHRKNWIFCKPRINLLRFFVLEALQMLFSLERIVKFKVEN